MGAMSETPRRNPPRSEPPAARPRAASAGFTIIEIVIAMIIISILTLVIVPVVVNKAHQGRLTAAAQEVQHLADASERAAVDVGYYMRVDVLNDGFGSIQNLQTSGGGLYGEPTRIFINISTENYDLNNFSLFQTFIRNETAFGWNGPYINFKRDINNNGWPDDPWGNDYLFFTSVGGLFPRDPGAPGAQATDPSQFATVGPTGARADIFDRPTFLSLGPDRLPGNGLASPAGDGQYGTGDDIFLQFGGGRRGNVFSTP